MQKIQQPIHNFQKNILKATSITYAILVFLFVFGETKGDISNGISFFTDIATSLYFISGTIIFIGISYFFAKECAQKIIIKNQKWIIVCTTYAVLIAVIMGAYVILLRIINQNDFLAVDNLSMILKYFFSMFSKTLIFTFLIWLWAGNKLKAAIAHK